MSKQEFERIWERARSHQPTAVIGLSPMSPPPPMRGIRVSCDVPYSTLGPIVEAQRKLEHILGQDAAFIEQARDMVVSGLRRRFLGDVSQTGHATAGLVDSCHRLATGGHSYVLIFDAVDAADDASLDSLRRLVMRRGKLALPLVLAFRTTQLGEGAQRLLASVREVHGDDAVLAHATGPSANEAQAELDWRSLPADVRQVLRAGAVIGSGFEADLLAALLERSPLDVLDCLQRAVDAGVPVEDRGEGRFFLPDSMIEAMVGSILPSLQAAWHRRLGWLLTPRWEEVEHDDSAYDDWGEDETSAPATLSGRDGELATLGLDDNRFDSDRVSGDFDDPEDTGDFSESAPTATPEVFSEVFEVRELDDAQLPTTPPPLGEVEPPGPASPPGGAATRDVAHVADAGEQTADVGDHEPTFVWEPGMSRGGLRPSVRPRSRAAPSRRERDASDTLPSEARLERGAQEPRRPVKDSESSPIRDAARAAGHLEAAGQIEAAAEKYAAAAGEAAAIGAYEQSMAHGRQALMLVESLPDTTERRLFRVQILIALGRLQWQAAGMLDGHPDRAFSLDSALETADLALAAVLDDDPPDLISEARELAAGICYDLGSQSALERALDELTLAARLLLASGETTAAACLLNDQAAVYVRLGDPVRATHLLSESQKIFERKADDDPMAVKELAETHHLFSRLPLHATIRPGRESDAYAMALDHAARAERKYRQLGAIREIARVWETMGRLELQRGQLEEATRRLTTALKVQSQTGDLTGMARSTAALSDVLVASKSYREALTVLGDSIALNQEKGSPIGLAYNRRSFDLLERKLEQSPALDSRLQHTLSDIRKHLEAAEIVLGRVALPGETGTGPG